MRLIDADELVKAIENENPGMSISGTVEKFARTIQVKMQPTIEAIPVEWIEKQLKKEEYRTFLIDYIEWGNCLHWLLEKWEKENEID